MALSSGPHQRLLTQLRVLRERRDAEIRGLIARTARAGVRSEDIADALGVSRSTLWRHYRRELHGEEDCLERRR